MLIFKLCTHATQLRFTDRFESLVADYVHNQGFRISNVYGEQLAPEKMQVTRW